MRILVVGETCLDVFKYGSCDRLAPEAPVPVFTPTECQSNPGMAMHVMKNVESLGVKCSILTNSNWEDVKKIRYVDDRTNQMFIRIDLDFIFNNHPLTFLDTKKVLGDWALKAKFIKINSL